MKPKCNSQHFIAFALFEVQRHKRLCTPCREKQGFDPLQGSNQLLDLSFSPRLITGNPAWLHFSISICSLESRLSHIALHCFQALNSYKGSVYVYMYIYIYIYNIYIYMCVCVCNKYIYFWILIRDFYLQTISK